MTGGYVECEDRMDTKLSNVNRHLARIVVAMAAIFAIAVTLLATITGETLLLVGTAFGLAAAGYAMQVARQPSTHLLDVRTERRHPIAA